MKTAAIRYYVAGILLLPVIAITWTHVNRTRSIDRLLEFVSAADLHENKDELRLLQHLPPKWSRFLKRKVLPEPPRRFRKLVLNASPVSDHDLDALKHFPELEELHLADCEIGDLGLRHVSRYCRLRRLNLSRTNVTDSGLSYLSSMRTLERLFVKSTSVSDTGICQLAMLPITDLEAANTNISENVMQCLAEFSDLKYASLENCGLSADSAESLRRRRPGVKIFIDAPTKTHVTPEALNTLKSKLLSAMRSYARRTGRAPEPYVSQCEAILKEFSEQVASASGQRKNVQILKAVKETILSLNALSYNCPWELISSSERDRLCEFIQLTAEQAGLETEEFDITEPWRDW